MMPHCRVGAMSVSITNFLDHVGKGRGYFGTLFDPILMTPPRRRNEDLKHVMAAWDCLAPGGHTGSRDKPGLGAARKRDRLAALPTLVCDSSPASGRTNGGHLQGIRTANAVAAYLGGKRKHLPN